MSRVNVHAIVLYVPAPEHNEHAILDCADLVVLRMKFLRDVARGDTLRAWGHYFYGNCPATCAPQKNEISRFKQFLPAPPNLKPEPRGLSQ